MNISELKAGQGKVDIDLVVDAKGDVRTFNKYGKDLRVCNATVKDANGGTITLSLWNDEIDKVKVGDKIKISNGYVSEFNGKLQLSAGKFGKMEIVSGDSSEPAVEKHKKPAKKASDEEELEF